MISLESVESSCEWNKNLLLTPHLYKPIIFFLKKKEWEDCKKVTTVWVGDHFKKFEWEKKHRNEMMTGGGSGGVFNRQLLFMGITITCLYAEQNHPERVRMKKWMGGVGCRNYRSKGFWQTEEIRFKAKRKVWLLIEEYLLHLFSKNAFSFNYQKPN